MLPAAFLAFAHQYPTLSRWPSRAILQLNVIVALLFATISLTTNLIVRKITMTTWGPTRETGSAYPLFGLFPSCVDHSSYRVSPEVPRRAWSRTCSASLFGCRNSNRRYGRDHHEPAHTATDRAFPI